MGMKRFVEGADRGQSTLLPECLDDWIEENNPVRVIDAFVDALDLSELGFDGVAPELTGRPSYHPSVLVKLYIYGYLNRVQSSRRLEREAGRNFEVMWLLGRLVPDHKTIADFRKDNGGAVRKVCARFVELCREMGLLATASVAIDGSKFKAVNNRDTNFTRAKMERRRAQLEDAADEYDKIDKRIKEQLRGVEDGIAGPFVIRGRWQKQSRVVLPADLKAKYTETNPRGQFRLEITKIGGDPAPGSAGVS